MQFPGPAGTIAVEAALKVAGKVTGRTEVACFTDGFHGMTLASLAVTGSSFHRSGAGLPLTNVTPLPYDRPSDGNRRTSPGSTGCSMTPAAVLTCPPRSSSSAFRARAGSTSRHAAWLRGLAERCQRHGILLIVDDVQMGCGRTGPFFSFEVAGIQPDIVCLSKSIGGYGAPLALTLFRPELDVWMPGEHSGTFRGLDPALVTGDAALRAYWSDASLERRTAANGERVATALAELANAVPGARARPRPGARP